jgi:hypothetical protein
VIREQGPESAVAGLSGAASPFEVPDESGELIVPSMDDVAPSFDDATEESPESPASPVLEVPDESGELIVPSIDDVDPSSMDDVDPSFDVAIEESPESPASPVLPKLTPLSEPTSPPPAPPLEPHPDASAANRSVYPPSRRVKRIGLTSAGVRGRAGLMLGMCLLTLNRLSGHIDCDAEYKYVGKRPLFDPARAKHPDETCEADG